MDVTRSVRQSHTEPHHNKSKTLFYAFILFPFVLFYFYCVSTGKEMLCIKSICEKAEMTLGVHNGG